LACFDAFVYIGTQVLSGVRKLDRPLGSIPT
jgi:hypothetical protein